MVKLFNFFILSTVVLFLFAIEYRVSPAFIVYVIDSVGISIISVDGSNILLPIVNVSVVRLFNSFILFTVVLFLLAIEYRVSPGLIV